MYFLIVIVLAVILIATVYRPGVQTTQTVDFTDFMKMVQHDEIKKVTFEDSGTIIFERKDPRFQGRAFEVYAPWAMNQEALIDELLERDVVITGKQDTGNMFWVIILNVLPLLFILFIFFAMMRSMAGRNNQAFTFTKSPARMMAAGKHRITFKDVAGVDEAVEDLQEMVLFLKEPAKFSKLGARMPKGVLLVGPPGTGKTLLARAVAGEANVPFFHMSGSDFVELFVGVGAARVRDLFNQAKAASPSLLFVDEIDAVGRHRGAGLGGGHDEREQTLNQILVEMDGFEVNEGIIVMAATNRPDILDPALLRPGRFDRKVMVDPPDVRGREAILQIYAKKRPVNPEVDMTVLARRTPGFVGADLENLVNEASLLAVRANKETITMTELEEAIDRVVAGPERRSRILGQKEKRVIAYHELGHAVMGTLLKHADPIHRVSIIPRGHKALAYTLPLPKEEKYLYSKSELMDKITVLLGGRAAEEVVFNEITSGAQDDIHRATQMARFMICELGMSKDLGPVAWGKDEQEVFLGKEFSKAKISEGTSAKIDQEIRMIIEDAYQTAANLVRQYRAAFDHLADILLEKEVIEGDMLRDLLEVEIRKHNEPKAKEEKTDSKQSEKRLDRIPQPSTE